MRIAFPDRQRSSSVVVVCLPVLLAVVAVLLVQRPILRA